jgi:hypothetical protein
MDEQSDLPADGAADQSDRVKPWTVKGIPPEVRHAAIAAANREKQPIGEWLARAIRNQLQSAGMPTGRLFQSYASPTLRPTSTALSA